MKMNETLLEAIDQCREIQMDSQLKIYDAIGDALIKEFFIEQTHEMLYQESDEIINDKGRVPTLQRIGDWFSRIITQIRTRWLKRRLDKQIERVLKMDRLDDQQVVDLLWFDEGWYHELHEICEQVGQSSESFLGINEGQIKNVTSHKKFSKVARSMNNLRDKLEDYWKDVKDVTSVNDTVKKTRMTRSELHDILITMREDTKNINDWIKKSYDSIKTVKKACDSLIADDINRKEELTATKELYVKYVTDYAKCLLYTIQIYTRGVFRVKYSAGRARAENNDDVQVYHDEEVSESAIALQELGNSLIKECVMSQDRYGDTFMESSDGVGLGRRVLDFFTRCVTKFMAWIKKGQIKRAREKLEEIKKDPSKNNLYYKEDGGYEMYTYIYPNDFVKECTNKMEAVYKIPIFDLIKKGNVTQFDSVKIKDYIEKLEDAQSDLKGLQKRMTSLFDSAKVKPEKGNVNHYDIDCLIKALEYAETVTYPYLQHCYDAIKIVKKDEKEKDFDDAKEVSQQFTRAMTLMGQCLLSIMTIYQKFAQTYITGSTRRQFSKDDKVSRYGNLTLDELYGELDEVFDDSDEATRYGIYMRIHEVDKKHYSVELYYPDTTGVVNNNGHIPCSGFKDATEKFIKAHSTQATAVKPSDLS